MIFGYHILEQLKLKITLQPKEELQFTKFLIDSAADAVFWVAKDARFLYVNQAACYMAGYSREELLSMTMHDVEPDFSPKIWSEFWKAIQKQGSLYFDCLHPLKEGGRNPVEITFIYLEHQGKEYSCIFVRNNTKRKPTEIALGKINEALKCKVKERTVQLRRANEQLCHEIAERKLAEAQLRLALEQEKDESELGASFVCMVSHEFRNPLHVISFATSLLKRNIHQWDLEKKLKYLHRIQTAAEYLGELMDNVFIIGKLEAGKLKFEPKAINLEQFCRNLLTQLPLSHSSSHTVNFAILGDCSTACVDEKLLQPMLTNLLDNAIKYSPNDRTVDLKLSCYSNEELVFQIKDQGIGIPPADQKRLFEPFYRGNNVGDVPGIGLGLAVVRKLVDLHFGQISVMSEVGVGTTFIITLPLGKAL
ncbi:sensor histidine kinase [Iningainema tapete]|uniref:histidine kinase n=1 Tax=Iningainema tapete BLCC-T55 TaxID=2748662 RepID=A0A8J6XJ22_9CYAN|nr:HAMP domain-containing sensor histidine kinase [Iningainema tapete]MBD2774055.1 PAS domain S-box protein [Iningainema tapete BLCC-T55]